MIILRPIIQVLNPVAGKKKKTTHHFITAQYYIRVYKYKVYKYIICKSVATSVSEKYPMQLDFSPTL